ncbi:cysteine hydrolase family protein [Rugosimonospora africana]|uniref:Peroxyureidoacrylate/ureidoacrylate amidohydrolase RutB n=1 Tax=Rugosimonospora africana TaxID=556532 RepID=A0A8J3VW29_9ACTN|nr:cysteine hydrolase [Rugosimonospora africana]GIH20935.1 peroxyureidoacrylate/ureidoacrylate amidohydrolase RutB [Rugosimonospora africana]
MALPRSVADSFALAETALLLIDLQRRHMDVDGVGYHTLPPERARSVTERAGEALAVAREVGLPIVHVGTWKKPAAPWGNRNGNNPFFAWQNGKPIPGAGFVRQADLCIEGSVYAEFMPQTTPLPHEPLVLKFRYSGFYMTDLELVLRGLGIRQLFIGGVNTNNCVLHTAFDAQARDFGVVLLEDAAGSMNGPDYHQAAVRQIEASIGWVSDVSSFADLVRAKPPASAAAAAAGVGG